MQSSWIYIKQSSLHSLMGTLHVGAIIKTLTPDIINIETKGLNGINH